MGRIGQIAWNKYATDKEREEGKKRAIKKYTTSKKGRAAAHRNHVKNQYSKREKYILYSKQYAAKKYRTPEGKFKSFVNSTSYSVAITFDQWLLIAWKKPCNYCGGENPSSGLDRVDNEKGYTQDNIIACCINCNRAKRDMSLSEFKVWINQLIKFQTKGD